ncbi:MAG: GTP cyclohydrolase I [Gammaproteobacteria bacterium]
MSSEGNIVLRFPSLETPEIGPRLLASRDRIDRAFAELLGGYSLKAEDVLNEVVEVKDYNGVVEVGGISFYSFCEHHFAPFFGTADVAYVPGKIITGLGKVVRLVSDVHARRLQVQELMTRDIAEDLARVIKAKAVRVVTRATHLCICSRGPKNETSWTEVRYACGETELIDRHQRG